MTITAVQTAYSESYTAAFPGQIGDAGPHYHRAAVNASGSDLAAGIFVAQGAAGDEVTAMSGSGDVIMGVVVNDFAQRKPGSGAVLPTGSTGSIEVEGAIWVTTELQLALGDTLYARYSSNGGNTTIGAVSHTSDSGHNTQLKGARVLDIGTATMALIYFSAAANH